MVWVKRSDHPIATNQSVSRVEYLREWVGFRCVDAVIRKYFEQNPTGEEPTLAVLQHIGIACVKEIAAFKAITIGDYSNAFDTVKRDIGRLAAVRMEESGEYELDEIETWRFEQGSGDSQPTRTRDVDHSLWPELTWVTSYTPHRLVQS